MAGLRNVATWPDEILAAVKLQLVDTWRVCRQEYCYETDGQPAAGQEPATDRYLVLDLQGQNSEQSYVAGGGNTTPLVIGQLTVDVWSRLAVDQSQRADQYLDQPILGIRRIARRVVSALQLFDPLNASSDYLLAEPMRKLNWTGRPRDPRNGWGNIPLVWEISYLENLTADANWNQF